MVQIRTNSLGGEVLVALDKTSPIAMHVQLESAIRDAIRTGRLAADAAVPASRRLANELGLSRGVVVEAYQQLTAEGYLISQPGGYTRVASGVATSAASAAVVSDATAHPTSMIDFRYGRPDVAMFPRAAWLRSIRRVLTEAPHDRFSYIDPRGAMELRVALAEYLNRVRGTWATPQNVIACNGFAQAWSLIVPLLTARGVRRVAVEEPSDIDAKRVAQRGGLEVVGIPLVNGGIDVDALERSGAEAVLLTSAHQFPTGGVLPPESRTALLDWARRTNALVIEDDYDAEYRYDQSPVGALHGLAPDHVIYAGTASKTLAPGLRLGWIVAPSHLVDDLAALKFDADRGSPVIEQLAFADFLARGELDRHLRKMRPIYRRRQDAMLAAIGTHLPELDPVGIAAGLHVFSWLPAGVDEERIVGLARERGLILTGALEYQLSAQPRGGLILGYARVDEESVGRGIRMLRRIFDDVR